MTALMDSPDYNPVIPNPDSQGSPFFHFLCSLSPIKPTIPGHAAQTLSELTFPPAPGVFVSPKTRRQNDAIRSKRKILSGPSDSVEKTHDTSERPSLLCTLPNQASTWIHAMNHDESNVSATASIRNGAEKTARRTEDSRRGYSAEAETRTSHHSQQAADILISTLEFSRASFETRSPKRESDQPISPNQPQLNLQNESNLMKQGYTRSCSQSNGGPFTEQEARNKNLREHHVPTSNLGQSVSNEDDAIIPTVSKYASQQSLMESWHDAQTEQLSKMIRSMHEMVDANSRMMDSDDASHRAPSFQKDEEQQACRAAMTGIRRRCLDFEPLGNQNNLPIFGVPLDKSSNSIVPSASDHILSQSMDLRGQTYSPHDVSNTSLLSQYTFENSTFASKIDPSYLPLRPKREPVLQSSDSTVPDGADFGSHQTGFSLATPLSHAIHRTPIYSAPSERPGNFLPVDGFTESTAGRDLILSPRNWHNPVSSANNLDLERVLSLVERIRMNQQEVKSLASSAHVETGKPAIHHPVMLDIEYIHSLLNPTKMETSGDKSAVTQEIYHQSESDHADDSSHSPTSPKKKRKLSIHAVENPEEGCKNCKCKKSKCLKLYCECFAAGVYCIDSCNCTECYNRPEFEEMVLGTRQQIESRNPLAFVPKIIRTIEAFPTIGEECLDTPASARHKRGCNCKKSQCLKKYCECYQAGVGCADGCRCEGCKNIFGRNEGPADTEEKMQQATPLRTKNDTEDAKLPINSRPAPDHQPDHSRSISPITPYIEHTMQCRSNAEPQSTEKNVSPFILPLSMLSFNSPYNPFESLEGNQKIAQMLMNTHPAFATSPNKITHPDGLASSWNGLSDMYALHKPLPQLSPVAAGILSNKIDSCQSHWQDRESSIPNSNPQLPGLTSQESTQASLVPLVFPSDNYQFENTFTVPGTPTLPSSNLPRSNYDFEEISDTASLQSAWFSDEENSPNILKESNSFYAPDIVLKTRSPQQKRVFSNFKGSNLRPVLSPVTGFKNGRKFILQSLSSSAMPW